MKLRFALALVILPASRGFDGGAVTFHGNLERVGRESVSIKLPDRRVIDALLPHKPAFDPTALAERYKMGDQVSITCKPISSTWDAGALRYQFLELTEIQFVSRPSTEEVIQMMEARQREGTNLLQRPETVWTSNAFEGPGAKEFERARGVNLQRLSSAPNFVADEMAKRFHSEDSSSNWSRFDTIESEVSFRGRRVVRQQIRRNGKAWNQPFDALPGFKWYEGFDTEIDPLFDPHCPAVIEYAGGMEFRFRSPVDGCFPFLYFGYQRYNPARSGRVRIDESSGDVLQVDEETANFPVDFEFSRREQHFIWDAVKIAGVTHLLPVRANIVVSYRSGSRYRVEIEYKNHRHFEASSKINFQ